MPQVHFASAAQRSLSLGLALLLTLATLGSLQTLARPDASQPQWAGEAAVHVAQGASQVGA